VPGKRVSATAASILPLDSVCPCQWLSPRFCHERVSYGNPAQHGSLGPLYSFLAGSNCACACAGNFFPLALGDTSGHRGRLLFVIAILLPPSKPVTQRRRQSPRAGALVVVNGAVQIKNAAFVWCTNFSLAATTAYFRMRELSLSKSLLEMSPSRNHIGTELKSTRAVVSYA